MSPEATPNPEQTQSATYAGREKLGDDSVAAIAMHTADNYHRIAQYVGADTQSSSNPERRHHMPAFRATHTPRGGRDHRDAAVAYSSDNIDRRGLLECLATARARLGLLAELSDERLPAVPSPSEMRFADGKRPLDQIVVSLLDHQRHQCDALAAALASSGRAAEAADRGRPQRPARRAPHRGEPCRRPSHVTTEAGRNHRPAKCADLTTNSRHTA
jgi:hypothetical protein